MNAADQRALAEALAINLGAAAATGNQFVYNATLDGVRRVLTKEFPDTPPIQKPKIEDFICITQDKF